MEDREGAFHYHGYFLGEYVASLDDPNDAIILETSPALQSACPLPPSTATFSSNPLPLYRTQRLPFLSLPSLECSPLPLTLSPRLSSSHHGAFFLFLSAFFSASTSTSWSHLRGNPGPLLRPLLATPSSSTTEPRQPELLPHPLVALQTVFRSRC